VAPICDEGFSPSASLWASAGTESRRESDIGGIGYFFDEVPEDPPKRNAEAVIPEVIRADIH
jgi:hypothetical protein